MKEEEAIARPKAQIQSEPRPGATSHVECEFWRERSGETALGGQPRRSYRNHPPGPTHGRTQSWLGGDNVRRHENQTAAHATSGRRAELIGKG